MAKKDKEAKKPTKPAKAPQAAAAPEVKTPEKKEEKKEKPEEGRVNVSVAANERNLTSRKHSGLSPDGQVRLLDLARRTFVEETDPDLQFPKETAIKVNKIVAIGILCAMADHGANGDDSFATVINTQAYPSLVKAGEEIGFKLPDIKALPAGTEAGTVMLPANAVEVPKETKEQLKKEKKIREGEKPELDPTKITAEEDVKKALEYMFVSSGGKRMPVLLTNAIDFMKKFREHQAELAENTDEAKARFANYNSGDWLDDIFGYFMPPVFFTGIGRGMASVTEVEKSPIHAFIIFRDAIRDAETKQPVLEDQETAYCVKSIVKWVCNTNIASNQKAIDNLDAKKNKAEIEKCEAQIQKYNNVLTYITSPAADEVESLIDNYGTHFNEAGTQLSDACAKANETVNRICKSYYGKQLSDADYKNLLTNVQQYAGYIINMFRDSGSQLMNYNIANISELEERSAEEKEAIIKEAKKAWDERKSKEKEADTKNA